MKSYRVVWTAASSTLAVVGAGWALTSSPQTMVPLFIASAMLGAICSAAAACLRRGPRRNLLGSVVVSGCACGAAVVAVVGLAVVLGAGVWLLAVCVLLTSPSFVRAYDRWFASASTPPGAQLNAVTAALSYAAPGFVPIDPLLDVRLLTNEQLGQQWLASCNGSSSPRTVEQLMQASNERRDLLDEMERRNPEGFNAWLASYGQALGGSPPRLDQAHASSSIDWDALLHDQE
jgi:hypothetical protein